MKTADIKRKHYDIGNINMHVVEAGPSEGTPRLFLHGFPDFCDGCKKQIAKM